MLLVRTLVLFASLGLLAAGCAIGSPSPTAAPTFPSLTIPAATITVTFTVAPTTTPSPYPTRSITESPLPSPLPSSTRTRVPSPMPAFDRSKFGTVDRDVTYCRADGVALKMDVYYPALSSVRLEPLVATESTPQANYKLFPAAIFVHGGAWMIGDKLADAGTLDIPELLARGYLVVSLNYRLAPAFKFPAQIQDVKCAVRYLRAYAARYNLASQHIGAWGTSAGGHLVALLGLTGSSSVFDTPGQPYANQSSAVQAVVDMYGPTDMTVNFRGASPRIDLDVFGATDKRDRRLAAASPVNYVSSGAPPFLIIQGDQDTIVPPSQSEALYKRLQADGVPARLILVKNAGHEFQSENGRPINPTRSEITKLIADFFDHNLR